MYNDQLIDYIIKCLISGIKESDTGLAPPALWDLAADKQTLQSKFPSEDIFFKGAALGNSV